MLDLTGRWKPIYRQVTFGETPFHEVKHGELDDMVIVDNGEGYMEHPKLFGRVVHQPITIMPANDPDMCIIAVPDQKLFMLAMIDEHGNLLTKWDCKSIAFNGYGVVYERQ